MQQQSILSKQIINKTPTEIKYPERSVFMKEVNTQNFWTFELGDTRGYQHSNMDFHRFSTK